MTGDTDEKRVRNLQIWKGLQSIEPLHGGFSNSSYRVVDETGQYVVRFGGDFPFHQVDRQREAIASVAAFQAGLSPEVQFAESGVIVLRYIEGRTFTEADVRSNLDRCLQLIRICHDDMRQRITGQGAIFWVFQVLRGYCAQIVAAGHRHHKDVPGWHNLIDRLEELQVPLPIVFGHHDLLPGNFVDDGKRLWLIDWEYAAFGTAMFDLANLASNNSFNDALEEKMLTTYFDRLPNGPVLRAYRAMKVASALREALWGMISELNLNAPGVDYAAYTANYLQRFNDICDANKDLLSK